MASYQPIIKELETSVAKFQGAIPKIQQEIYREVVLLVKELEIKNGVLKNSIGNIKKINTLKAKLQRIILNDDYKDAAKEFIKTFEAVTKLNNAYFKSLEKTYTQPKVIDAIKTQSIQATVESLTEAGISQGVVQPIYEILRTNITTGGSLAEMQKILGMFIEKSPATVGVLERYTSQITTDAINQYNATYTQTVSLDLGWDWFEYVGSNIKTTRTWCKACTKKRYVHRSEFPDLIKGDFAEFKEMKGQIYDKTDLPQGMIEGTNESNLTVYRGGYNCGHQFYPVSANRVPANIRSKII
jgi:hypothetical protein